MQRHSQRVILVVEDDDTLSLLTEKQLAKLGFQGDGACDGRAALRKVKDLEYCLILMDIQMPVMDGIEATVAIRQWEKQKGRAPVPIVAMTANPDRQRCVDAGMDDFIFKPVMLDQLTELLTRWFSSPGKQGQPLTLPTRPL